MYIPLTIGVKVAEVEFSHDSHNLGGVSMGKVHGVYQSILHCFSCRKMASSWLNLTRSYPSASYIYNMQAKLLVRHTVLRCHLI